MVRRLIPFLLLTVLVACGGSEEGSDSETSDATAASTATDEGSATDQPSGATDQPSIGDAGSFTVDGEVFAVTLLNRCIPFTDAPGNIDLQALAQGAPGAKLNLYLTGSFLDVSVDGSAISEMFGSIAFGDSPVVHESNVTADRWTGSATVGDSLGSGTTVEITWDVAIPAEVNDCSL